MIADSTSKPDGNATADVQGAKATASADAMQAHGAARAMVAATTSPNRETFQVVDDFASAVARLHLMAGDWRNGKFRADDLASAASTVDGLFRLLVELRADKAGGNHAD